MVRERRCQRVANVSVPIISFGCSWGAGRCRSIITVRGEMSSSVLSQNSSCRLCDAVVVTRIVRLIGVYDADGTLRGELAYWIGARLGNAHCSLCDITHGLVRERADWKRRRAGLAAPFDTYHRDDQPNAVRIAISDVAPAVIAETTHGLVPLLGPQDLDRCAGTADLLLEEIDRAMARTGLTWPTA